MIIPKSKINEWKTLREHGDLKLMSEVSKDKGKHHVNSFSNAFTKGRATEDIISEIDSFYKERKKQIAA